MKIIEQRPGKGRKVYTVNDEPSMTDPQWEKDCDVNSIMARFIQTKQITHLRSNAGVYADLTEISDLAGAYENVQRGEAAFSSLPSNIRDRFQNNPIALHQFLSNPKNYDEAVSLGLIVPKAVPTSEESDGSKAKGRASKTVIKDAPAENKDA